MRILHEALTFDDVMLQPAYSEVLPREVALETRLARALPLNIPIVSAAMDTVTEARLAISLAQEGGIGIIHKNMSPEEQARHVFRVKKFESGIISDPITVAPDTSIQAVIELTQANSISGVPVVEGEDLVGIVTHRDLRFETQLDAPVSAVMTPKDRLVTVRETPDKDEVLTLLHRHRIEKVLVVDNDFRLRGMITAKDFQKATDYPRASKDELGALRVGAAVGTAWDTDERVAALVDAGVDVLVIDTAHGHTRSVLDRVRQIRADHPDLPLIAGNVATGEGAQALAEAGADPFLPLRDGTTPLMMAAGARWANGEIDRHNRRVPPEVAEALHADEQRNLEAARFALELGAGVGVRNEAGDTALHSAVYKAWPAVVQLLVDHGGDLDAANAAERTPRQMMCREGGRLVQCAG